MLGSNCTGATFKHDPSKSEIASGGMFGSLFFSTWCFLYVVSVVMGDGLDHGPLFKGIAISTGIDAGSAMAFLRPHFVEVIAVFSSLRR